MRLFARSLLVASAAGSLFVGPTVTAFAAGEPSVPPPGNGASVDADQLQQLLDQVEGDVNAVVEKVTTGPGSTGGEKREGDNAAPTKAAVPAQGPEHLCPVFGQIRPELQKECENALGGGGDSGDKGGDGDGDGPALDQIFDELPDELYAAICQLIDAIDEQMPDELKIRTIYGQLVQNEHFTPIAEQIPTKIDEVLREGCGPDEAPGPKPKKKPSTMDQPRPVSAATLPKTGGAPLWLIPLGLFLMALGSKLVWPVAKGR